MKFQLPTIGILTILLLVLAPGFLTSSANAQEIASTCLAVAQRDSSPPVWRAQLSSAQLASDEVRIIYVGHSAFRLESESGVAVVTDFFGNWGDGPVPNAVTMNHAHSTHFTSNPDPAIEHVLRGWNPDFEEPAQHRLQIGDMLVRNVPTDLYRNGIMIEKNGNSIFIFEVAGLCIGHLGHLHHKLTPEHIADIGRLDVIFMPVDGTYTMSQQGMIEIAQQLRASIVIPMHFFSTFSLQQFLAGMESQFAVSITGQNSMTVSLRTLPTSPQVSVLLPF